MLSLVIVVGVRLRFVLVFVGHPRVIWGRAVL